MRTLLWLVFFGSVLGGLMLLVATRTVNGGVIVLAIAAILAAFALLAIDDASKARR